MVVHSCYVVLCWETQGALNLSPLKSTEGYRRVGAQFGGQVGKSTIKSESVREQCKELDSKNHQGMYLEECSVREGYVQLYSVHKHRYGLRFQNFWLEL